jgi:hypothetical protein
LAGVQTLVWKKVLREQFIRLWIDNLPISKKAAKIHAELTQKGQIIQDADIEVVANFRLNKIFSG